MKRLATVLLFLLPAISMAQSVSVPTEVRGLPGTFVVVRAATDGGSVQWYSCDPGLSLIPPELLKDGKAAVVMAPQPGRYRLIAWTAKGDVPSPPAVCVVIVGEPGPDPPKPDPIPPKPDPVDPSPIPLDGFRVLIVYESKSLSELPAEQSLVLYSRRIRDYFAAKCVKGPDGKTPEARIYDQDQDLSGDAKHWQDALKRKRDSIPWIVISTGKTGHEGPLPATVDDTLKLLKKYGGE